MFTKEQGREHDSLMLLLSTGRVKEIPKDFARKVALEVPLGELAEPENASLVIQAHVTGYRIEALTGKEHFNAQGLEGKVVIVLPYATALSHAGRLKPYRFRIVEISKKVDEHMEEVPPLGLADELPDALPARQPAALPARRPPRLEDVVPSRFEKPLRELDHALRTALPEPEEPS